jgi:hypothetical protein
LPFADARWQRQGQDEEAIGEAIMIKMTSNAGSTRSQRCSNPSPMATDFRVATEKLEAHIGWMNEKPTFRPQMSKSGRWFVAVTTGYGPDSHIGDYATEEEAQNWISTKSKDWPSKPVARA